MAVDKQTILDHVVERLEDDGLLHTEGCRLCWVLSLWPRETQYAVVEEAAAIAASRVILL